MPLLQLAIDLVVAERAMDIARKAGGYFDILEAGTPLIKSAGIEIVKRLKKEFPQKIIFADLKIMDAGALEAAIAFEAGADIISVCGQASAVKKEYDFYKFTERFPKERFGNGIDWEKAEADGLVKPVDFIEGVSIKKTQLQRPQDFALESKVSGLPDIIFSHKKHTVWMGCEGCHPEIFLGVKKGTTKYTMVDIFQGKYCGVCHNSVAFPLLDCQRCHTKQV
ncbi:MAG: orotidine 5'-phosphate decarboxylase / HUMPS family protein [Thermodesulfovibrionales bacterium]